MKTAIAIDLGATNLRVALVDTKGKILKSKKTVTPKDTNKVVQTIIQTVKKTLSKEEIRKTKGIGISVAGPIDPKSGSLLIVNLGMKRLKIVEPLRKKFKKVTLLSNDANAAVRGEQNFGFGKGKRNLVYITISTGIGAGIISDGKLLLGRDESAGEVGHFKIFSEFEVQCGCGAINHWQAYCSGKDIPNFYQKWAKANRSKRGYKTAKDVFNASYEGEKEAKKFLEEIHKLNAQGVENTIMAFNPDVVILGGSVVNQNEKSIINGIKKYLFTLAKPPLIKATKLGDEICLLGAAASVFENL